MLTNEQLRQIRERCDAATPGPWHFDGDENAILAGPLVVALCVAEEEEFPEDGSLPPTIEFLANARTDVPALLQHIAELTAILDSAVLMWDDRCGGFHGDRSDIDPRMPSHPVLVLELSDGHTDWRAEWPVTDTGVVQTSTLGSQAADQTDAQPQDAEGETR